MLFIVNGLICDSDHRLLIDNGLICDGGPRLLIGNGLICDSYLRLLIENGLIYGSDPRLRIDYGLKKKKKKNYVSGVGPPLPQWLFMMLVGQWCVVIPPQGLPPIRRDQRTPLSVSVHEIRPHAFMG